MLTLTRSYLIGLEQELRTDFLIGNWQTLEIRGYQSVPVEIIHLKIIGVTREMATKYIRQTHNEFVFLRYCSVQFYFCIPIQIIHFSRQ